MKEIRHLLVLAAVFLTLLIIAIIQSRVTSDQQRDSTQSKGNITAPQPVYDNLTLRDMASIRLQNPQTGKSLIINQSEAGAWSAADINQLVDQQTANAIASAILTLTSIQSLDNIGTAQYAQFGLHPDNIRLLIQILRRDGQAHTLAIGNLTPTRDSFYGTMDNQNRVYVIERGEGQIDFLMVSLASAP